MSLRYSVWAAVSSKGQAAVDKVSLKVQLEHCHAAAKQRHWKHVRDYSVPGQTRTQWTSLYHAEKNIPALHDMLEAASRGEFDILIVYDLNRFRDLMRQVFDALCDSGIQLYILADPREPVAPEEYTEERKNEIGLTVGLRDIISRSEITNLQRHYRDKMPSRITDKGLHAGLGRPPFGFQKPQDKKLDRQAILEQVPAEIRVLNEIKDWFLAGASLTSIAERLNQARIPSPRGRKWWYSIVRYVLANPYYAGIVHFGGTKRTRNRRAGTIIRHKAAPITATGKHKPVWDLATHRRILSELERRGQAHPGLKTRQLSRLLYCWCGSVLWAQVTPAGETWRCSSLKRGHITLRDDTALEQFIEKMVDALGHLDELTLPTPQDTRPSLTSELADYRTRRQRLITLAEMDDIDDLTSIKDRINDLSARIKQTEDRLRQTELVLTDAATTKDTLQELSHSIATLPKYYRHGPKEQVNADLHSVLRKVIIDQEKGMTLVWR